MVDEIKKTSESRMKKSIETLKNELGKFRAGRAHPSLLDQVTVMYYDNPTPLAQVASVTVSDPRTLMVTPWEKQMVPVVEKAIMTADLGLNPATSGNAIRVPLPPLTEERRRELLKVVRGEVEQIRVSIRNIRRDANNDIKALTKDKTIGEDDERRGQDLIQKLTDKYIAEADALLSAKEADLMEV